MDDYSKIGCSGWVQVINTQWYVYDVEFMQLLTPIVYEYRQTLDVYFHFLKHVYTYIYFHYAMYLMNIICWAVSVWAIMQYCIQLIKLNCIIIETTQVDALPSIKRLIIIRIFIYCLVFGDFYTHALLSA